MARPALRRGEHTAIAWEVREPGGEWRALSRLPARHKPPRGSTWRARTSYRSPDRTRRVTAQGRTKGLAEQALRAKIEELRRKDGHGGTADTLGERIEAHIKDVLAGRVARIRAQRSRAAYASMARVWCLPGGKGDSQIAGIRVDDLTVGDLNREVVRISSVGGGRSQLRHIRAIWRAAVQRAVDDGVIHHNPVRDMAPLPSTDRDKPRTYKNGVARGKNDVLTDEQVAHLLEVAHGDPRWVRSGLADLTALVAAIGLRIGEANSVRWEDVDLDSTPPTLTVTGKIIRVPEEGLQWEDFAKTESSSRTIPLPEPTAAMLRHRREALEECSAPTGAQRELIFPSTTGTMHDPDNRISQMRQLLDAAELPWATTHTIRRTVENRLLREGAHPLDIERVMGHTMATARQAYWDRQSVPVRALPGLSSAGYLDTSGRQKLDRNSRKDRDTSGIDGRDLDA